jgi:hypothetical protein
LFGLVARRFVLRVDVGEGMRLGEEMQEERNSKG